MRTVYLCAVLASALAGPTLSAQQRVVPSPAEAQALLQARPDLASQLRQQIGGSGLTPEQIRTRLRAEGYPENFLDGLMPGSTGAVAVTDDIIGALGRLGITGQDDAALLRTMLRGDSTALQPRVEVPRVRDDSVWGPRADTLSYRLFGLETFRNATSEFIPVLDGPVDANYRLGPGDQLVLILTGEVELAHTLDVTREGFIVIPQVGQLSVGNLTMSQLEDLLYARLSRSYSGVRRMANAPTKFTVSVARLRAIQVFVTGEVERPASYRISSASTAMTALYAAGGPTERGTLRNVEVRRGGRVVAALDVYDYLVRGDNSRDVRLENGDIVFVGTYGPRVRVSGEVVRPATYEVAKGETLRDLLVTAGGLLPTANASRLRITRIVPAGQRTGAGQDRNTIDVAVAGGEVPAVSLEGGDELTVFPVADRVRNRILVQGHVWTPGTQGLRPGMLLSDALRAAGGPKPDVYLGQVSVTRLRADSTRLALRAALRDSSGAVFGDFPLQEDDEITVYSVTAFRPAQYVAIGGSVRRSGQYPWREGMTLRDLVLAAGGLTEGAYLREAEVARLPERRTARATATTIRVPLDSTYLAANSADQLPVGARNESAATFRGNPEVLLLPYDNVLVMQEPDWITPRAVVLSGEIRFPGRYTLVSKDERLSDVIRRAGGLTADAAVDAAFFARAIALTAFRADSTVQPDSSTNSSTGQRPVERARVGLDLGRALRNRSAADNLVLLDGDSLHLPLQRSTVEIRGAVNAPTVITSQEGQKLSFYVRAGGGASLTGDERKAYVIQPNGQIQARRRLLLLISLEPTPRPGATVVVPVKSTESQLNARVAIASVIAQTIASLATVYAILR